MPNGDDERRDPWNDPDSPMYDPDYDPDNEHYLDDVPIPDPPPDPWDEPDPNEVYCECVYAEIVEVEKGVCTEVCRIECNNGVVKTDFEPVECPWGSE